MRGTRRTEPLDLSRVHRPPRNRPTAWDVSFGPESPSLSPPITVGGAGSGNGRVHEGRDAPTVSGNRAVTGRRAGTDMPSNWVERSLEPLGRHNAAAREHRRGERAGQRRRVRSEERDGLRDKDAEDFVSDMSAGEFIRSRLKMCVFVRSRYGEGGCGMMVRHTSKLRSSCADNDRVSS